MNAAQLHQLMGLPVVQLRDTGDVPPSTSTRTEVRSPTRTSTRADTRGNFTATVTGGAGAGETNVTINIPAPAVSARRSEVGLHQLMGLPVVQPRDTGSISDPSFWQGAGSTMLFGGLLWMLLDTKITRTRR